MSGPVLHAQALQGAGLTRARTPDGRTVDHLEGPARGVLHDLHLRATVLPGSEERDLWVTGGVVTYEPVPSAVTVATGVWVLPGLVDAHCHIGLDRCGPVPAATAEAQAVIDRDAGVCLVRDAGSPSDTRWIDQRDDLPAIVRAGQHVARTKRYLRDYAVEVEPDDLVATVVEQARRGDGWVKLVGDWIDRSVGDLAPSWPADVVAEAIVAAHAEGARVTAHCFAEQAPAELVVAGIDGIEHGTGLDDTTIALMAERGTSLVPTLANIEIFPGIAAQAEERFPVYAAHMRDLYARRHDTLRKAYEAGVPIFAGTDAGGHGAHGRIGDEVVTLGGVIGTEGALGAASWRARQWLGWPGLGEGSPADLVVLTRDPRLELTSVREPALVVRAGRVVAAAA